MKLIVYKWICLLSIPLLQGSCAKQDTNPCKPPSSVTVDSQCYAGNGLALTADGYGENPLSFEWHIYAQKDTSRANGWSLKDEKIKIIAGNKFLVADSLVTPYLRLIVTVSTNCGGLLKESTYYSFIKKQSTNSNMCTTWINQTL